MTTSPLPQPRVRRLSQLLVGLVLFGVSLAMVVAADLGLAPWDVFHQGVSLSIDLSLGIVIILTSLVVLLLWIPIKERPGIGTIANAILVGAVFEIAFPLLENTDGTVARWLLLAGGIVLNGIGTGMYIGAGLGPGPRDGLMTGLAARGPSIRVVRTGIEITVLLAGIVLGGSFGIGTLAFAFLIGPLVQLFLPPFVIAGATRPEAPTLDH